ncbi:MAG TPA: hypothetical protein VK422_16620 [Pyrinomonadaceae bacterium]|nr:hypothetical protein [Pyrinomonadaceae bacterium]
MRGTLALVLLFAVTAGAQEFERAREAPGGGPAAFEFELSGYSYHVASNGNGRRAKGGRARPFNLRLEGRDSITRLRFSKFKDDLLLLCEVSDGERQGAFAARLEQPSMRARWKLAVPSSSIGPALREGQRLYLTGRGFVALLDVDQGAYVWQHVDLHGRRGPGSFEAFERPERAGREVLFRERPVYNGPARTAVVDNKTGRLVRVE